MVDTIIIMVGLCIIAYILSHADIKITLAHTYPQATVDKSVDNVDNLTDVDKIYEKEEVPTFDDIVRIAQEMIGGTEDGEE